MNDNSANVSNNSGVSSNIASATSKQINSYVDDYRPPVSQDTSSEPEVGNEIINDPILESTVNAPISDKVSFDDLIEASVSKSSTSQTELGNSMPTKSSDLEYQKPPKEVRGSVEANDEVTSKIFNE